MRNQESIHLTRSGMILAVGALAAGAVAPRLARAAADSAIDIKAANWKFTPDTITVAAGKPVTLRLTSEGGVHGLQSDELGIPKTAIYPGKFVEVTFTPKKAGTYQVHCAIPCGPGHKNQFLTIVVK